MPILLAAWPFIRPLLPYLIAAGLVGAGWLWLDQRCNSACSRATEKLVDLRTQVAEAQQRATDLALLWSRSINNVEVRYVAVAEQRSSVADGLRERANALRLGGGGVALRVDAVAGRLLSDAADHANDSTPAEVDQGTAAPVPDAAGRTAEGTVDVPIGTTLADWAAFTVEAAAAYRDAADKHMACVAAYEAIFAAQQITQRPE